MSQYSQRVQEAGTRVQQIADMVHRIELVVDDNTDSRSLTHPFSAVNSEDAPISPRPPRTNSTDHVGCAVMVDCPSNELTQFFHRFSARSVPEDKWRVEPSNPWFAHCFSTSLSYIVMYLRQFTTV